MEELKLYWDALMKTGCIWFTCAAFFFGVAAGKSSRTDEICSEAKSHGLKLMSCGYYRWESEQ